MTGTEHFWALAEGFLSREGCAKGTMMGFPCLRRNGAFFACLQHDGSAMIAKMSAGNVAELVNTGEGQPFAPAGKVFREWVAIPTEQMEDWPARLEAAWDFASP